jgi:hypothetical protein
MGLKCGKGRFTLFVILGLVPRMTALGFRNFDQSWIALKRAIPKPQPSRCCA